MKSQKVHVHYSLSEPTNKITHECTTNSPGVSIRKTFKNGIIRKKVNPNSNRHRL